MSRYLFPQMLGRIDYLRCNLFSLQVFGLALEDGGTKGGGVGKPGYA
jgi:hypothetical protein